MSKKFVILAGPTATGKTKLAIQLANLFPFDLISADSRQVYRHADIVTGKDHPQELNLAGIDICSPCQDVSVSIWFQAILPAAQVSWRSFRVPFFVGGTGFYLKALTSNIETMSIPPNPQLRQRLNKLSLLELQAKLRQLNPQKLNSFNFSDRSNPRRLIRAIEIAVYLKTHPLPSQSNPFLTASYLFFVLQPPSNHRDLIRQRVIRRLELGAIAETQHLLQLCGPEAPVLQSLGYRSIMAYLQSKLTFEDLIKTWTTRELQYAKRQLIWFKKQPHTIFIPTSSASPHKDIVKHLKTWYYKEV